MAELEDSRHENPEAYHGTSQANADQIIKSGFQIQKGADNMLGDGVYFWDAQFSQACRWAKKADRRSPAVIKSNVRMGRRLNLTEEKHADMIRETIREAEKRGTKMTEVAAIALTAHVVHADTVTAVRRTDSTRQMVHGSTWPALPAYVESIICVRTLQNILSREIVWRGS
jgi:hypothetical protein